MTKLKRSLLPLILFFVSLSLMLVGCTGHKISEKWSGDLTQHWHECDRENCVLKHNSGNHEGGTATCMKLAICSVCEKEYGEVDTTNHTYWDEGEKTVAHDGCYILYSCKCGATRKELTPELINEAYSILLNTKEKMTNTDKLSFNVKEFNNNEFSYGFDNENKLYYFELDDGNGYYSYDKVVLESDKYYLYEKSTLSAFESTEVDENYVKNMQTLIFNNIFNSIPASVNNDDIIESIKYQMSDLNNTYTTISIVDKNITMINNIYTATFIADIEIAKTKYAKLTYEINYDANQIHEINGKLQYYKNDTQELDPDNIQLQTHIFTNEFNLESYNNAGHFVADYTYDELKHWQTCFYEGCEEHKHNEESHIFDNGIDQNNETLYSCECGMQKTNLSQVELFKKLQTALEATKNQKIFSLNNENNSTTVDVENNLVAEINENNKIKTVVSQSNVIRYMVSDIAGSCSKVENNFAEIYLDNYINNTIGVLIPKENTNDSLIELYNNTYMGLANVEEVVKTPRITFDSDDYQYIYTVVINMYGFNINLKVIINFNETITSINTISIPYNNGQLVNSEKQEASIIINSEFNQELYDSIDITGITEDTSNFKVKVNLLLEGKAVELEDNYFEIGTTIQSIIENAQIPENTTIDGVYDLYNKKLDLSTDVINSLEDEIYLNIKLKANDGYALLIVRYQLLISSYGMNFTMEDESLIIAQNISDQPTYIIDFTPESSSNNNTYTSATVNNEGKQEGDIINLENQTTYNIFYNRTAN